MTVHRVCHRGELLEIRGAALLREMFAALAAIDHQMPETKHDTVSVPYYELDCAGDGASIVALRDIDSGEMFQLAAARGHQTVGSGRGCDVRLDDPTVSHRHCVLIHRGRGRVIVRDLGSKNGVVLDRNRVSEAELRPGAELRLGQTILAVVSEGSVAARRVEDILVGEDPGFTAAIDLAKRVARRGAASCSVLILGETGTGKELIAQLIHQASTRADGPFVTLNCGGLTGTLIASELFGHIRGAFTDATTDRPGVFAQADGGTLFLDELGELPLDQQPHLLRALETREVRPLGSISASVVDVHFVAATNRLDLSTSHLIRADLYHRVATVTIALPSLRERRGDIPLLIDAFIKTVVGADTRLEVPTQTMRALETYSWPGNVRELRHAVMRALTLSPDRLDLAAFLPELANGTGRPAKSPREASRYESGVRSVLQAALSRHGSVRRAATALGIPKSTFADRARRYGVKIA